jgi:hypothetical protein
VRPAVITFWHSSGNRPQFAGTKYHEGLINTGNA